VKTRKSVVGTVKVIGYIAAAVAFCVLLGAIMAEHAEADRIAYSYESTKAYRIEKGDTLWNIAQDYPDENTRDPRVVIREICELNGLDGVPTIYPGETIIVPDYGRDAEYE
jgi:nucleoid-associated protein YgaU